MAFTYELYKDKISSEKIGLCVVEAAKRLMGWELHSGSIYKYTDFNHQVITELQQNGNDVVEVFSIASVTAGKYYFDRDASIIYLRTSDSSNPNSKFISVIVQFFFSNFPLNLPYDLASGFEVEWLPYLDSVDQVGAQVDRQEELGVAIEGSGGVSFLNKDYWRDKVDQYTFENKRVSVYSWNRELPISEAKLIYRGFVERKSWEVSGAFRLTLKDFLNQLTFPVDQGVLEDIVGARIPDQEKLIKRRRIYGKVKGLIPNNIDQVLNGYPLVGIVSNVADVVFGLGTEFLRQLTPNDEILIGQTNEKFYVKDIGSDTLMTLSVVPGADFSSSPIYWVSGAIPKRYINRTYAIAEHAIREPLTTVTRSYNQRLFVVADASDFEAGDLILVGSDYVHVQDVRTGNIIKLVENLPLNPPVGTSVKKFSISKVRINNEVLSYPRDYTYDATAPATLYLDELAEFNIAKTKSLPGQIVTTMGDTLVTGVGTQFTKVLKPNDWIRIKGYSDFAEILEIVDDTNLYTRTDLTYTDIGDTEYRSPEYLGNGAVVSMDLIGKTSNNLPTGTFLDNAPKIVRDLLVNDASLGAQINEASFTLGNSIAPQKIGFAVPQINTDTNDAIIRDVINQVNKSVMANIVENPDFEIEFSVISPDRPPTTLELMEHDLINFRVQGQGKNIVRNVAVKYGFQEYEAVGKGSFFPQVSHSSEIAEYLVKTDDVTVKESVISLEEDAQRIANRRSFLLEMASNVLSLDTKLKPILESINSTIDVEHRQLFHTLNTAVSRRIGSIQKIGRSINGVQIEVEDLSNAFARCARIAPNDTPDYDEATSEDKFLNGFITDQYGLINKDFGSNLIW